VAREATQPQKPTLRVDVERVDRLVNVAGELVIHNAMLADAINRRPAADPHEVARSLDQLRQLSRMIQDSAMAIRAQPVKPLFDRMHRILREAAASTGKKARLELLGESTEVDRTIIERLADPLTHMVRNAVDHGIETPERRRAAGKPETGTVRIEAQHRSGRILIVISDDGGGIDRARVQQIAVERGLIPATAEISASDIDNLLFLPGFSTARTVSALSGRGVGMDVVRSAILALGGRIGISSTPGQGTSLRISLPLTLAVMDGMVIRAGGQPLVLPLSSIVETLSLDGAALHPLGEGGRLLELRGHCLPMVSVAAALGLPQDSARPADQVVIVVEREDKSRIALIVDGIDDQRQIVIKSLDENYGHIPGIAAATVLGDGAVALIVDPAELVQGMSSRPAFPAFSAAAE
jgi:two-component system chemotaxis sensor kinase CheA